LIDNTFAEVRKQVTALVEQKMYGLHDVIHLCLVALFTKGHILLEGNPGLGKTALARELSEALYLPNGRIQFTPDLMPSDITGTFAPGFTSNGSAEQTDALPFRQGPVFTSLLLADEINRATPKTQAAMLEAMAERQVTVLGITFPLDSKTFPEKLRNGSVQESTPHRPFLVMATQNPIDQEGTYDLPEAQSDRFMFKILMPVPNRETLQKIIQKEAGDEQEFPELDRSRLPKTQAQAVTMIEGNLKLDGKRDGNGLRMQIRKHPISDEAGEHITNLFLATNQKIDEIKNISNEQREMLKSLEPLLLYGLGPRAARDLTLAAKALSLSAEQEAERNEAGASVVAKILLPVLRHRLKPKYSWEDDFQQIVQKHKPSLSPLEAQLEAQFLSGGIEQARRADMLLKYLADACAPTLLHRGSQYRSIFKAQITQVMKDRFY